MSRALAMLIAVITKELRQTVRDRRLIFLLASVPVVQLPLFAYAVNFEVDRVPTVVLDLDDSHRSRSDLRRILADHTLEQVGATRDVTQAQRWLETGKASVVLQVPRGFERDVVRGRPAKVQAIVDGSDPNRASVAVAAVTRYFAEEARTLISRKRARVAAYAGLAARVPFVELRTRAYFNPGLQSAVYMVPGLMAILLLLVTTNFTALGLSRERERGTLEQILVTPVPSSLLILGKVIPFALFGLLDFGLALVTGSYLFDMPIRGSLGLLVLGTVLYLLSTLGVGMMIASVSANQQQAFLGGFFFILPAALLSGILTPIRSMPDWLQPFTLVNPLRHYAELMRSVLLRGAVASELQPQLWLLGLIGVVTFGVAIARFRRAVA